MTFGERCTQIRKRKKVSQADMGKLLSIDGDAYGRYERDEVKPSIDMAVKISNALMVSLDFLVGKTDLELDNNMLKRIQEVSNMDEQDKEHVFSLLDAFIAKTRLKGLI
ncbi:MAG: helix-turn-helix transcriptional regulator [Flavobacteriales bacterium]|nr:helix-turn-helix transcriptional regulator [Flavobacteriales bacterium]